MAGKVVWNGPKLKAQIEAEMRGRLEAAAVVVHDHAKELISREGAEPKGGKKGAKLVEGARRSKPGEPPMSQSGNLRRSVAWEIQGLVARVGTGFKYGRWLELGTSTMAARPWLRRSLVECMGTIRALIGRPMGLR
jgi:hypothetical protein